MTDLKPDSQVRVKGGRVRHFIDWVWPTVPPRRITYARTICSSPQYGWASDSHFLPVEESVRLCAACAREIERRKREATKCQMIESE